MSNPERDRDEVTYPAAGAALMAPLEPGSPAGTGPVVGDDGVARCPWGAGPGTMRDYHDQEWGRRVHGEAAYLERLTLEAFQSGLSWSTILHKRPAFREVFAGFDADVVAGFTEADRSRLMTDARIVRNRLKIAAAVTNARATVALRDADDLPGRDRADAGGHAGGLEALVLSFRPAEPPAPRVAQEVATTSPASTALSKELKRRGFVFVGPTTMHALMQAVGVFDPHLLGCHRRDRG